MNGLRAALLLLGLAWTPAFGQARVALPASFGIAYPELCSPEPVASTDREKPPPPDLLARGKTFKGTWFKEKYCEVLVLERDREARTAVLRITSEKLAFFRVEIETNDDGSKLKIIDIRCVKPPPGEPLNTTIDFERGSGKISRKGVLTMQWDAMVNVGRYRGSWNGKVSAK